MRPAISVAAGGASASLSENVGGGGGCSVDIVVIRFEDLNDRPDQVVIGEWPGCADRLCGEIRHHCHQM